MRVPCVKQEYGCVAYGLLGIIVMENCISIVCTYGNTHNKGCMSGLPNTIEAHLHAGKLVECLLKGAWEWHLLSGCGCLQQSCTIKIN